ncbi:primosomal protein DnaI [Peribacillus deserti]|uniref:Primosomal protein DnaI n=1 Tax=Peribacillus deserti TaxID=673318 RepID=A0ABS2QI46_9BACI|nr:primosomal protein DnaI [Peribacillus deserti]MBM7692851.1 primosomal protein DnaI [Peribacillus deserti]
MERINDTLNKLANRGQFRERYNELSEEILSDPNIVHFLNENSSTITKEMIDKSMGKLYEYSTQSKECGKCPSLEGCINMMQGYHPHLVLRGSYIDINYDRCPRKEHADEKKKHEKLIQSLYVPKEILSASIADFDFSSGDRLAALEKATEFVEKYTPGSKMKGLYLYGKFGVGKTYLLGAIANELARKRISSLLVYVPDFLREIKNSISDHTLGEKLEMVKKAPVLMLDDLGAETMSSWGRDEVFGPILQFRMLEDLPTFFTSNFDFSQMKNHLTVSQRGEIEEVKAARIMERIRYLAEPVLLDGSNRRR